MVQSARVSTREAILRAAREVFRHYGCAKTSMSDLARASELSRTALYKHFPNKEEVFRALAQDLYEAFRLAAEDAASSPGPALTRLERVLKTKGVFHEWLAGARHGAELLDENHRLCGDLLSEAMDRFEALVREVLEAGIEAGELDLAGERAGDVAATLVSAVEGISYATEGDLVAPDAYERDITRLMKLVTHGLASRPKPRG